MGIFQRAHTRLGAIASRILLAGNPLQGSRPHWLIIFTLIESCALYTFNVVAALATFLSGSFGQYAAVNSIVPVVVSVWCISKPPFDYRSFVLGHLLLSHRTSDSVPCHCHAWPPKSFLGYSVAQTGKSPSWRGRS
jgi:hypothetical protein